MAETISEVAAKAAKTKDQRVGILGIPIKKAEGVLYLRARVTAVAREGFQGTMFPLQMEASRGGKTHGLLIPSGSFVEADCDRTTLDWLGVDPKTGKGVKGKVNKHFMVKLLETGEGHVEYAKPKVDFDPDELREIYEKAPEQTDEKEEPDKPELDVTVPRKRSKK